MKNLFFSLIAVFALVPDLAIAGDAESMSRSVHLLLAGSCIVPILYFLPSIIAGTRGHAQSSALFLCNLLLSWTIVGWLFVLVWAFVGRKLFQGPVPAG